MIPTIGRIVHYKYREDGQTYPAIICAVQQENVEVTDGERASNDDPSGATYRCHLQIFRPRGNDWKWAVEGDEFGEYHWPVTEMALDVSLKAITQGTATTPPTTEYKTFTVES